MPRTPCAYCGLAVTAGRVHHADQVYCCYGCYLASRLLGSGEEPGPPAGQILRLGIGAFLAMNVMMIALVLYTERVEPPAAGVFRWAMLGLSTPALAILGYPLLVGARAELARRRLSLDTLIVVGSLVAYLTSAANTLRGDDHVYFDTATMLPVLVTFGRLIEATAKTRTSRLSRALETLLPRTALRLEPTGPREVPLAEIRAADRLRVRPGERFPVDGTVVEGSTWVEEAAFTGEVRARPCGPGEAVLAGTVNGRGSVVVRADRVGSDVLLQRIIDLAEAARRQPAPLERLAEHVAAVFIPVVFLLAAGAGLYWLWARGPAAAGLTALAVLVVACPCAMGLATPVATALAIGRAAQQGVLVRGGDVLELAGSIQTVFFDKTGTITTGQLRVLAVEAFDPDLTADGLLAWLATLESASEHALARAVVAEAARRGIGLGAAHDVQAVPGLGVRGRVSLGPHTRDIWAGAETFVSASASEDWRPAASASTVIEVAWDGRPRGRVLLTDEVRPEAPAAVGQLRALGVDSVLVSGDRPEAAAAVAQAVGIGRVEARLSPEGKVRAIRRAQESGRVVAMVGDGINDAPALAAADIGIALGAGTDLARQAGHVLLLADRLDQVPWLVALSRRTRRIIAQNLAWAFGYNGVALGAAAAGWLHPLLAAVAMAISSLTVLGNSWRVLK